MNIDLKKMYFSKVRTNTSVNCNICDKKISRNSASLLKKHIELVHEGNEPHKCTACGKSFSQKHRLKKHMESVHERKKPYKCLICHFSSFDIHGLKRHALSVHENKKLHTVRNG